jgi:hypothetical protein
VLAQHLLAIILTLPEPARIAEPTAGTWDGWFVAITGIAVVLAGAVLWMAKKLYDAGQKAQKQTAESDSVEKLQEQHEEWAKVIEQIRADLAAVKLVNLRSDLDTLTARVTKMESNPPGTGQSCLYVHRDLDHGAANMEKRMALVERESTSQTDVLNQFREDIGRQFDELKGDIKQLSSDVRMLAASKQDQRLGTDHRGE